MPDEGLQVRLEFCHSHPGICDERPERTGLERSVAVNRHGQQRGVFALLQDVVTTGHPVKDEPEPLEGPDCVPTGHTRKARH